MLSASQVEVVAYRDENAELWCYACAHSEDGLGAERAREGLSSRFEAMIRYTVDEEASARVDGSYSVEARPVSLPREAPPIQERFVLLWDGEEVGTFTTESEAWDAALEREALRCDYCGEEL